MENVSLPVSNTPELYPAVMKSWSNAMSALNNLILGQPLRVHSGDILLGISSWHLYPDMAVMQERTYRICQNDALISPGGVVTIGLEDRPDRPDRAGNGIYWSLPLAHLRYYGAPVQTTRHSGLRESQVSFEQFRFVILGSVLWNWGLTEPDLSSAFRLIIELATAAAAVIHDNSLDWLHSLAESCGKIEHSTDTERKERNSLIKLGQRKCRDFLCPEDACPAPAFGLANLGLISQYLPGDIDDRVMFLRKYAQNFLDPDEYKGAIIRYRASIHHRYVYTNCFDSTRTGRKRRREQDPRQITILAGWRDSFVVSSFDDRSKIILFPPKPGREPVGFTFLCGNIESVAIFFPSDALRSLETGRLQKLRLQNRMTVTQLLTLIENHDVDTMSLIKLMLQSVNQAAHKSFFDSLQALSFAEALYQNLPGSSVDLQVTSQPVYRCCWAKEHDLVLCCEIPDDNRRRLLRPFSCIAMFETGCLNIEQKAFDGVVALAYRDSLFIARYLLDDPVNTDMTTLVSRVSGNVGKSGLSLIMTPANPEVRHIDCDSWHVVEHVPCDGKPVDHFTSTSTHLSLTGYELPLDINSRGSRNAEVNYIEAAISLHEGAKWIADLDVVAAAYKLGSEEYRARESPCGHIESERAIFPLQGRLVSVQNWTELLDPPLQSCIFLAHGNSLARFAAVSLCIQRKYEFKIMGKDHCWPCALRISDSFEASAALVTLVGNHVSSLACAPSEFDVLDGLSDYAKEPIPTPFLKIEHQSIREMFPGLDLPALDKHDVGLSRTPRDALAPSEKGQSSLSPAVVFIW